MTEPAWALEDETPTMADLVDDLAERRRVARTSAKGIMAQHARGRLTARERLELLFDDGAFNEVQRMRKHRASGFGMEASRPDGDGVVVGWGLVHGRRVFAYAHDFTVFGGSLGEAQAAKIHKIQDLAYAAGCALVSICDSAGARIQEGITALAGYGGIFRRNVRGSGVIPQISVMVGPCAGGAAYSPALTDFVFMVRGIAQMFVTGPDVVEAVTGESTTHEDLGGADVHSTRSGVAAGVYDDEESCLADVRFLLSMLPDADNQELDFELVDIGPRDCPELAQIVPANGEASYDVRRVVKEVVDSGEFFELHAEWATNIVIGMARLGGRTIGLVANQPSALAGVLDIHSSVKAARFVQFCDAFRIPIVTLVDVPGFLPGIDQEHNGVIRHGAKLLYAYCNATVPRVQVILRKAYGGAYIVMDSPSIGCDISFAWPTNEIAVMGADGAVKVIHRRRLAASATPEEEARRLREEYVSELGTPYVAAERGIVDEVIDPVETRDRLIQALEMLRGKDATGHRPHGNPPV